MKNLGHRGESNPGPLASATSALTTELRQPSTSKTALGSIPGGDQDCSFFPLLFSRPL